MLAGPALRAFADFFEAQLRSSSFLKGLMGDIRDMIVGALEASPTKPAVMRSLLELNRMVRLLQKKKR